MANEILGQISKRLETAFIPARLSEEGTVLSVLLSPPVTDFDIYGDIFFARYGGDPEGENEGLFVSEWEVLDITGEPDEVHANLSVAISILNTTLPAGGFCIEVIEPDEDEESDFDASDMSSDEGGVRLIYRLSLPVGAVRNEKWLENEAYDAVETSVVVLKATAKPLLDFARGIISFEELSNALQQD